MTERMSTGLRNWLLDHGSLREGFKDCCIKIYSGAAPAEADDAVSGNLLVTIYKSSTTPTTKSFPNTWKIRIPETGSTGTNTMGVDITYYPAGVATGAADATEALYTSGTYPSTKSWQNSTIGLARVINDCMLPLTAVLGGTGAGETGKIFVACDIPGDEIVLADTGGDTTVAVLQCEDESRSNGYVWFGAASDGAISKVSTDTWSGTVATTGVAGYFRIVRSDDDGTESTTQIRLQGNISTSGSDMNLSSTSLTAASTLTLDSFSITLPAE